MVLSSLSSSFLFHSDTVNLKDPVSVTRKSVDCFACCLWFCLGKSSEVRSFLLQLFIQLHVVVVTAFVCDVVRFSWDC